MPRCLMSSRSASASRSCISSANTNHVPSTSILRTGPLCEKKAKPKSRTASSGKDRVCHLKGRISLHFRVSGRSQTVLHTAEKLTTKSPIRASSRDTIKPISVGIVNPKERTQAYAITDHATLQSSPLVRRGQKCCETCNITSGWFPSTRYVNDLTMTITAMNVHATDDGPSTQSRVRAAI